MMTLAMLGWLQYKNTTNTAQVNFPTMFYKNKLNKKAKIKSELFVTCEPQHCLIIIYL